MSDGTGSEEPRDDRDRSQPDRSPARDRLRAALRPKATRTQALIGVLFVLLGFAMAVQVRAHQGQQNFETARLDELVGVLDGLSQRSERLRTELQTLRQTKRQVESGYQRRQALVQSARQRADALGLLAGTLPATGPGIELTIADPENKVDAALMLDALQELRDAGAEVIQIGDVRVVASTHFVDPQNGTGVVVDGQTLRAPYRILAIGDPATLSAALGIPGGVLASLNGLGAQATIVERDDITITALRDPPESQYARPATGDSGTP